MMSPLPRISIGLIGDYNARVAAHQAIPLALQAAGERLGMQVSFDWVPTETIIDSARVERFEGIWCVPASPYRNMDGALLAICHARRNGIPYLGTCGGFQHAVVEYARNVLGWTDADHGETSPQGARLVIAPLVCSLVEAYAPVRLVPGTRIAAAYGSASATEGYHCSYGLNPEFQAALTSGPLRATAYDEAGEVRGIELDDHPFFVATLFQPERAALQKRPAPLVEAFLQASEDRRKGMHTCV